MKTKNKDNRFWIAVTLLSVIFLVVMAFQSNSSDVSADSKETVKEQDVVILNSDNFESTISKGITVIDFWATWCMPCKIQGPIVADVAKEVKGKAVVAKLDIDKSRDIANKYMISAVPTILIFKDGKEVKRLVGLQQKKQLVEIVNSL